MSKPEQMYKFIVFQLLPRLHDIATQSQTTDSPVSKKLKEISEDLKNVLEKQMQSTLREMIDAATRQCKGIMRDEVTLGFCLNTHLELSPSLCHT